VKFIQLVFILGYATTVFASDSPDTREITDPKSIVSSAVEGVVPISVDDLFYTRSIGAGAWSPDGKQIVFIRLFQSHGHCVGHAWIHMHRAECARFDGATAWIFRSPM
jgi:hypothetical protein